MCLVKHIYGRYCESTLITIMGSDRTTVIAPPFLKMLYASEVAAREEIGPPDAGGIVASEDLCKIW